MLEPADLSAAADPANCLTDEGERDVLAGSAAALALRASLLADRVNASTGACAARRTGRDGGPELPPSHGRSGGRHRAGLALARTELEALRRALEPELVAVSRYAEPAALRPLTFAEMTADPDALERALGRIRRRLAAKAAAIDVGASREHSTGERGGRARAARRARCRAQGRARWRCAAGSAADAASRLPRRPSSSRIRRASAPRSPSGCRCARRWRASRRCSRTCRGARTRPPRPRPARTRRTPTSVPTRACAARASLRHVRVGERPPRPAAFTGFMADEWAERRPSRMQQTGLAINYDSPQSEPPHVLLLCEPAGPRRRRGRRTRRRHGGRGDRLMKVRSLAAQDRPLPGPLFPFANRCRSSRSPAARRSPASRCAS